MDWTQEKMACHCISLILVFIHYIMLRFDSCSGMKIAGTEFSALPWHHLRVWSLWNDDSPSEEDKKWLIRVMSEPYLLHVKDTLADFEKEQANAATIQHPHPQSGKELI